MGDTVSNSKSVAVAAARSSSRALNRVLFAGSLAIVTMLAMQPTSVGVRHDAVVRRPILLRLISAPAPAQPSAYDRESGMSRSELLDRWSGIIAEASKRFHV